MSKKVTLASLKALNHKFQLVHPVHGELDAWVEIRSPRTNDYFYRSLELADITEDASVEERVRASAELAALLIVDWDGDFFGDDFDLGEAITLFCEVENFWIRDQVSDQANKPEHFFSKG